MRKKISELGTLISFLEYEKDPWGIKDLESRFIYANNLSHLGIKFNFDIEGMLDSELPHPVSELSQDLIKHDKNVIFSERKETAIQTTFNFKEKKLKPYFFEKRPFHNKNGEVIGTIYHGREIMNFDINSMNSYIYLLDPPNNLFSKKELNIIFLIQLRLSSKEIARRLNFTTRTIETYLSEIYSKVGAHSVNQFIEYCKSTGFNKYIPQDFLQNKINFVK